MGVKPWFLPRNSSDTCSLVMGAAAGLAMTTMSAAEAHPPAMSIAAATVACSLCMAPSSEDEVGGQGEHVGATARPEARGRVREAAGRVRAQVDVVVLRLQRGVAHEVP